MNYRSRSHHTAHLDDGRQDDVPELELVHRGEPTLAATGGQLARLIETLRADGSFAYDSEFIGEQDRASEWVSNAEELSSGLARVRGLDQQDVRKGFAPQRERLRSSIANVEAPYAADRILDSVERLDVRAVRPADLGVGGGFLSRLLGAGRRGAPQPSNAKKDERTIQKFPGVAEEEIRAPLAQWADAAILSQAPQITRFHDRLWVLH